MRNKPIIAPTYVYFVLSVLVVFQAACKKAENIKSSGIKPEVILKDSRVGLIHLYKDTVYLLKGELKRQANEELVIDEGTLIKVTADDYNDLGSISIEPGGVIRVNGTMQNPVIFTSNVYTGNQKENWNGIAIHGNANRNTVGNSGDTTDFSGSLTYMRVEFGSLTMDAVGSGTRVENIMVSYSNTRGQIEASSSFNFLGGSFNAKNLVSYACGGPADFYITDGYNGKIQNMLAYRNYLFGDRGSAPINALCGLFIENNEYGNATALPYTNPAISNLTVLGPGTHTGTPLLYSDTSDPDLRPAALVITGNAFFQINNSLLLGFPEGGIYLDDLMTAQNLEQNFAKISNTVFEADDSTRTFYLEPNIYPPYTSQDLENFLLGFSFNNQQYYSVATCMFHDPFNYEQPGILPEGNSPILNEADFTGVIFSDPFFNQVNYRGAIGTDDWLKSWTNFIPLRTNYNFSE